LRIKLINLFFLHTDIIAYSQAFDFFDRIFNAVESDERLAHVKTLKIKIKSKAKHFTSFRKIALFRRIPLFVNDSFDDKIKSLGILPGASIKGMVIDLSQDYALVDVQGFNGVIHKKECSWRLTKDCRDVLELDGTYDFFVMSIDPSRTLINLTLKNPENDPWRSENFPDLEDIIEVELIECNGYCYTGLYVDNIVISIPRNEISWVTIPSPNDNSLLESKQKVIIYDKSDESKKIKGSIRRLEKDPWPIIHEKLPRGTELRGIVAEVNPNFVTIDLPDGLQGIIPRESMIQAGFEYEDYESSVVIGQGLDVVVTKIFLKKQKIRLDLKRNIFSEIDI